MARVRDVLAAIDRAAPFDLQQPWDNSGLQLGDPSAAVRRVLVALDATGAVAREARRRRADLVVAHHPLFFEPIRQLSADSPVGAVALDLAATGVALVAAHTNYDAARGGLNDLLARKLGLVETAPLEPASMGRAYKLVTFVPAPAGDDGGTRGRAARRGTGDSHAGDGDSRAGGDVLTRVERALYAAGAGRIGDYSECSFRSRGSGTFLGGATTHPTVGRRGRRERVAEVRLETIVPADRVAAVVRALREAHSYEEPAFDLYPLEVLREGAGIGRAGRLARPASLSAFVAGVKRALGVPAVEVVGRLNRPVSRVAVVGGSAGDLWRAAQAAGCDVLVTGELKHADRAAIGSAAAAGRPARAARAASSGSFAVMVAGHWATEYPAVAGLVRVLRAALPALSVAASRAERNPTAWR